MRFNLFKIRLRAAGGLSEPVDQENVENYSKSGSTQASSGYTSGIGNLGSGEVERVTYFLFTGTGYSSVRAQSSVSNQRYSTLTSTDSTDNYQVGGTVLTYQCGLLFKLYLIVFSSLFIFYDISAQVY